MIPTITPVKNWMRAATAEEQQQLADMAGTSRSHLYQLAGGHRQASTDKAISIERASKDLHKATQGRLPILWRTDLARSCKQCEFAKRCLGEIAAASQFPIVGE